MPASCNPYARRLQPCTQAAAPARAIQVPVYVDLEWDAHDANKRLSLIQLTTGRAHEDRPVLVFDAIEILGTAACPS